MAQACRAAGVCENARFGAGVCAAERGGCGCAGRALIAPSQSFDGAGRALKEPELSLNSEAVAGAQVFARLNRACVAP